MLFRSSFRQMAAALLAVLLPFAVLGGAAHAQTIENIAQARWQFDGASYETQSNLVSVERDSSEIDITVYRPKAGSGTTLIFRQTLCTAANGSGTAAAPQTGQAQEANVEKSKLITAGSVFFFEVNAARANTDASRIDELEATLVSSTGDSEIITIFETGENTGIFVGSIGTHRVPPAFSVGDCRLGVVDAGTIQIGVMTPGSSALMITAKVDVMASPFNIVFDSETGAPVSGARITLVDADTGQPAIVFSEGDFSPWPSSVMSGQTVMTASGSSIPMGPGEFWFPLVPPGSYRLIIEPPSPYTAPSVASPEQLGLLRRTDDEPFVINAASFGEALLLSEPTNARVDVPLDRLGLSVTLSKSASRQTAQPGDVVLYTIIAANQDPLRPKRNVTVTDTPSPWLRLREDSVRIDGEPAPSKVKITEDGTTITFDLGELGPGASSSITYAMSVRADAPPGDTTNRAVVTDLLGRATSAGASIRVERESIANRMTIIGRVTAGPCDVQKERSGIPGVRVMLEDGSFAITDVDGRYHFEGVVPGTHVVQVSGMTLPDGGKFINCQRDSRSAGSAISRFAIGQGGSLVVADFHAHVPQSSVVSNAKAKLTGGPQEKPTQDEKSSEIDWLALGDGPDGWLAPAIDENPRAPAIRVAIRHRKGQKVDLRVDGRPVDQLLFDGTRNAQEGKYAVSTWRGVPLNAERTVLRANIINSFGVINDTIEREVFFTTTPAKVEIVEENSMLVADGRTNPTVAVRILDRNNRPLRAGISGEFTVSAPYQSAEQIARQQLNQLTGIGAGAARWTVRGNDGVAMIELAPTMVSGSLQLGFRFDDGDVVREQKLETWIEPGEIEWTVIGLAEGSVGARTVADNMERAGRFDSDLGDEARVALYAKGRVLGKYLVTLAYDSAKQEDDHRLLGALDPDAYYTVFADASARQFDAASREKLYVRIESSTFYALYGDFQTGFDQTRLARYNRVATGLKGEARLGEIQVDAFAAEVATGSRRDEIQGQGISGPYRLSSRSIVANSERVTLEVRDRFRSELVVSSQNLTRFLDYDIDLLSGTLVFKEPVLSRDFDLNPQFIVVTYETYGKGDAALNAGVRAEWTDRSETVQIGANAISDKGEQGRTHITALDMRAELDSSTVVRAELALSHKDGDMATGWLMEAQHQTGKLDILAYARSVEQEFGVGQQNDAELGRTKVGLDARVKVDQNLSVLGSIWHDDSHQTAAERRAAQLQLGYTDRQTDYRLGIAHFADRLADGSGNTSTVLEGGATRRMMNNQLELGASTSVALDKAESADLPTRHRLSARYALTEDVRIIGTYELANGENVEASTIKGGLEVTPWEGAQAVTTLGKQSIDENGNRSFAAFGLSQRLQVSPTLTIDATIDGNRTIDRKPSLSDLVNPEQPLSSGGQFGNDGTLFEDFTAATFGAAYRKDRWSATARAEYRDGEFADRKGLTMGAIRQLGEGVIVGSGLTWTRADAADSVASEILDAAIAIANRPDEAAFAFLGKLEYRSDAVWNAVAGEAGPAGRTALIVDGDARSRRLVGSFSGNWSPKGEEQESKLVRRDELGIFLGGRYNFDQIDGYNLSGTTFLGGADLRIGIGERSEIGGRATIRANLRDNTTSFSFGPNIGFLPAKDALLTLGYNVSGFRDEDFSAMRQTDRGFYLSVRLKFDADTFGLLRSDR